MDIPFFQRKRLERLAEQTRKEYELQKQAEQQALKPQQPQPYLPAPITPPLFSQPLLPRPHYKPFYTAAAEEKQEPQAAPIKELPKLIEQIAAPVIEEKHEPILIKKAEKQSTPIEEPLLPTIEQPQQAAPKKELPKPTLKPEDKRFEVSVRLTPNLYTILQRIKQARRLNNSADVLRLLIHEESQRLTSPP